MTKSTVVLIVAAAALAGGIFFDVSGVANVTPAVADELSYPWCTQGDTLQCYYANRQQCEETVDYHGFCLANPEMGKLNREI
jgi:hypothetical protein